MGSGSGFWVGCGTGLLGAVCPGTKNDLISVAYPKSGEYGLRSDLKAGVPGARDARDRWAERGKGTVVLLGRQTSRQLRTMAWQQRANLQALARAFASDSDESGSDSNEPMALGKKYSLAATLGHLGQTYNETEC
ncbi:hypothetical protein ABBQ38_008791 [Trebouxia sp. C0009 RCD-2024]